MSGGGAGRGIITTDDSVRCPQCGNGGTVKEICLVCDGEKISPRGITCPTCAGTGTTRTCAKCGADCSAIAKPKERSSS